MTKDQGNMVPEEPRSSSVLSRSSGLKSKIALSLALGLVVVLALSVYGDFNNLLQALIHFQWAYLPAILGLTVLNYLLRCLKWRFFFGSYWSSLPQPS